MKKMRKLMSLFLAFALVLSFTAPLGALAADAEENVTGTINENSLQKDKPTTTTVNVHKLQADSYNVGKEGLKHNGGEITDLSTLGSNVKGLPGVTFTYFKVTAEQFKTLKASPGSYDTVENVKKKYPTLTGIALDPTNAQGVASVDLGEGYYWFVESNYSKVGDGPDSISSSIAVPFGISLPLTNTVTVGDNEPGTMYMKTVHVYPKNVTGNKPKPEKDVNEINQKNATYKVGQEIDWIIKGDIPANIKDYGSYSLTDKLDEKLTYIDGSAKVYYGNFADKKALNAATPLAADYYTVSFEGDTLKVTLNTEARDGKNYVKDVYNSVTPASKDNKLYVIFKAKINEKAIMGQDIKNGVDLTFTNKPDGDKEKTSIPDEEKPKVVTGGKLFVKVDADKADTKLEGAVFTIKHQKDGTEPAKDADWKALDDLTWTDDLIAANKAAIEAGKFAKTAKGDKTTATTDVKAGDRIYLRSSADGTFEIKGLEFSAYTPQKWDAGQKKLVDLTPVKNYYALQEVKAPKGYGLNEDVSKFTIDKTSYYTDPDKVTLGDAATAPAGTATALQILNKNLTIPQTGGMGTIAFILVGLALMTGAFVAIRRRSV